MTRTEFSVKFAILGFMSNVPILNMIFPAMCRTYVASYVVKNATLGNCHSSPFQNLRRMISLTPLKSLTPAKYAKLTAQTTVYNVISAPYGFTTTALIFLISKLSMLMSLKMNFSVVQDVKMPLKHIFLLF
jgi:hypothetical protein